MTIDLDDRGRCSLRVGDRVTAGEGTTVYRIDRLWQEEFPAYRHPQWVARLVGGPKDISMRAVHLHLHPGRARGSSGSDAD